MKHLLFIYGTLKQGECRESAMKGSRYLGVAVTAPDYVMFSLGSFPALKQEQDGDGVYGELYEVDDDCLEGLDDIEGVDHGLYERRNIELASVTLAFLPTDRVVFKEYLARRAQAYIYKGNADGSRLVFW